MHHAYRARVTLVTNVQIAFERHGKLSLPHIFMYAEIHSVSIRQPLIKLLCGKQCACALFGVVIRTIEVFQCVHVKVMYLFLLHSLFTLHLHFYRFSLLYSNID